ncbi:hypothetical protein E3H11_38985 [Bradyrhizobium brasilense]|nr:hypothetical protein [Bradyrhizobium brasilense]
MDLANACALSSPLPACGERPGRVSGPGEGGSPRTPQPVVRADRCPSPQPSPRKSGTRGRTGQAENMMPVPVRCRATAPLLCMGLFCGFLDHAPCGGRCA